MKKASISFLFTLCLIYLELTFIACNKTPLCDGVTPTYDADAASVVNSNCALSGCHVAGFSNGDFTTYDGLKADAKEIQDQVVSKKMPPSGSLSKSEIQIISCWVDNGSPEN